MCIIILIIMIIFIIIWRYCSHIPTAHVLLSDWTLVSNRRSESTAPSCSIDITLFFYSHYLSVEHSESARARL